LRVGVEDTGCGGVAVARDCANAVAFVSVDSRFVVAVDYGGAAEAARYLEKEY